MVRMTIHTTAYSCNTKPRTGGQHTHDAARSPNPSRLLGVVVVSPPRVPILRGPPQTRRAPQETTMPNAIPVEAESSLPPARMIDPRGHRFGAGLSAILLVASFVVGWVPGVFLALLSIGTSAAFGLKYSIYGAIWRRIVRIARARQDRARARVPAALRPDARQHRAHPVATGLCRGLVHARLGLRACRGGVARRPRTDGLLPGLPAVLPALVGAVGRNVALDAWPRDEVRGSVRRFVLLALSAAGPTTRSGPRSDTARSQGRRPPRPADPGAQFGMRGGSRWRPRRASR